MENNTKQPLTTIIKQNKMVAVCTAILLLVTLIALFAYIIIPDNTENANRQTPQISLQGPGYTQSFLVKEKNIRTTKNRSVFERLINGQRDVHTLIPYSTIDLGEETVTTQYDGITQYHESKIVLKQETRRFFFGTDKYGRDVFSRLILGLRISLVVGLLSVLVSITIGILLGSLGGYYGGRVDNFIMLIINTSWSIPTLLMAFAIIIALGKGFLVIVLAVGLTMWVDVARIVRGQVMQVKNDLYVKASKVMGFNDTRIIVKHILPNIIGSILVMAAANFATAILVEAGLSYLGLGIQPPTPSLGNMLQESYAYATGGFVYLAFFPIITIMMLVLCFNLLGTGLRDIFDIKSVKA